MQVTYGQMAWAARKDELVPEETRGIPFFGFVTGTLLSLAVWAAIAWAVWAVLT